MPTPTELRHQLRAAGFDPLPLHGKRPAPEKWQKYSNVSSEQIRAWSVHWPDAVNTGTIPKFTPAIDIDILDQDTAEAIEDLVRRHFEDSGRILIRIGLAPKRAVLLRCDQPFKKIKVKLIAPNGDTEQKIEVLGDGQQVVVH